MSQILFEKQKRLSNAQTEENNMAKPKPKYSANQGVYIPKLRVGATVITCAWAEHMDEYEYLVTLNTNNSSRVVLERDIDEVKK